MSDRRRGNPGGGAESPIDLSVLRKFDAIKAPGQSDLALEVIEEFLAERPARRSRIVAAAGSGDLPRLGEVAHILKSSAGALGARQLAERCERVESAARAQQREAALREVPELLRRFDEAAEALMGIRARKIDAA